MNASWSIGPRLLAALTLLASSQCAREQAPPLPAAGVAPAAVGVDGGRSPAPSPTEPHFVAAKTPAFETLVPGLSLLADERIDTEGHVHEWIVARIDLHQHGLQVRPLPSLSFTPLPTTDLLIGVNGGFFDPKLQASGLLLSGGRLLAPGRAGGGSGVLAVAKGRAQLLKRGEPLPAGTDFAVQCGPRLIEPGGSIGIYTDDGQRAARTAACLREQGRELNLVIALSKGFRASGPSLLQLAQWLAAPLAPGETSGCHAALNLDGGPSTGIVVPERPQLSRAPLGPVPFAVVVSR